MWEKVAHEILVSWCQIKRKAHYKTGSWCTREKYAQETTVQCTFLPRGARCTVWLCIYYTFLPFSLSHLPTLSHSSFPGHQLPNYLQYLTPTLSKRRGSASREVIILRIAFPFSIWTLLRHSGFAKARKGARGWGHTATTAQTQPKNITPDFRTRINEWWF